MQHKMLWKLFVKTQNSVAFCDENHRIFYTVVEQRAALRKQQLGQAFTTFINEEKYQLDAVGFRNLG